MFAKGWEETFPAEILRVVKVIQRMPQPVYEILNLQALPVEGQFYNYDPVKEAYHPKPGYK